MGDRRVAWVRSGGATLDWQPLQASARHACKRPAGSIVLESTRDAVVYSKGGAFYGCLKGLGPPRSLLDTSRCYYGPVMAVRLAGRFAALQAEFGKPPMVSESDTLYDLSSGKPTGLVSVPSQRPDGSSGYGLAPWRSTRVDLPRGERPCGRPWASSPSPAHRSRCASPATS
jgi:hypothetical protein